MRADSCGPRGRAQGILEQMKEQMAADLKEAEESEASAIADNDALVPHWVVLRRRGDQWTVSEF